MNNDIKEISILSKKIENRIDKMLLNYKDDKSVREYNSLFEELDDLFENNKFLNIDNLKISDIMKNILKTLYQSQHYEDYGKYFI